MSTMSAIVLVTTTSLTSDILRYLHPEISDKKTLLLTRVVGVTILLIAAISAVDVPQQIVPLVSVSMGVIACCVFVPLIFGLYWDRGTQTGFIASLLASFFSVVTWNFYGNPTHPPRLHRSHLRHGGLRGRKSGDEPAQQSAGGISGLICLNDWRMDMLFSLFANFL